MRSYVHDRKSSSEGRPGSWQIVGGAMVLAGGLVPVRGPADPSEPDPQGGTHR